MTQTTTGTESGTAKTSTKAKTVLAVKDLRTKFATGDGTVYAVNGTSFHVDEGELLGVVGESGSGKSVTMMSLLKLIPIPPGEIYDGSAMFDGQDLVELDHDDLRNIRGGKIGFIFQDPMTSLNPVITVGKQITESVRLHTDMSKKQANERALELLTMVGIPDPAARLKVYPHEMSGGMRQRVMIAIALACQPKLIIADEPTTALDVTIQAQIIDQVRRLREELGTAVIWITHDLAVVAGLADRVMVMYGGRPVEIAPVDNLYEKPSHPYTRGLLASLPEGGEDDKLVSIPGQPPNMFNEPTSCSFAPRCEFAHERCLKEIPEMVELEEGHFTACFWDFETSSERS